MLLYKYRSCAQRTWELLLNRKLFFATPARLNDPLDSSIDIQAEYERAEKVVHSSDNHPERRKSFLIHLLGQSDRFKDRATGEAIGLNGALQAFLQSLGICSFSRTPTDPLLWSHYANGHSGVCLSYDSELLNLGKVFIEGDMTYASVPPYLELFLKMTDELGEFVRPWDKHKHPDKQGDAFYTNQLPRLMRANLLVKSEKWKYEQEYRIIVTQPGFRAFNPNALREVIRGTRIADSDRETISSILRHPDYAHVLVRDVKNVPGTFEFGLSEP